MLVYIPYMDPMGMFHLFHEDHEWIWCVHKWSPAFEETTKPQLWKVQHNNKGSKAHLNHWAMLPIHCQVSVLHDSLGQPSTWQYFLWGVQPGEAVKFHMV